MEEVDSIILQFLKQLDLNIPEDIKSLCDLPVEIITESATKCLTTISPSLKLPARLPPGISHRIEVAALIASACKDLGYKNDVGYQTFLYHNETELRQVFMFLIEHLPSEGAQSSNVALPSNQKSLLMHDIGQKIAEELKRIWIPQCCNTTNKLNNMGDCYYNTDKKQTSNQKACHLNEEDLMEQLSKIKLLPEEPLVEQKDIANQCSAQEIKVDNSKSLKELKEMSIILKHKLNVLESERNVMEVEFQQANKLYEKALSELQSVQNILKSIGLDSLSDDDIVENILEKVQMDIEKLHMKCEGITSKNLELKVDIDKHLNNNILKESERSRCRNTLLSLKNTAKSMKEEYNHKEQLRDKLKKTYDKLKGGNKRSVYTKRILEIIGNVDKQNLEIKKILDDTRQLQKEINTLEGQLDRCFSIADETLFGDAKKDDQAKKAYKLLALLHSECNTIVSLVNETGTLAREIVDLEDNIKSVKTKRTEDTLKKIQQDLTQLQEESNTRN